MPNKVIKDYNALKNAIKEGATKYIALRKAGAKPDKSYSYTGLFHAKDGLTRAQNLLACCQGINMDELSILALSVAIFKTSGTWLQTEIAHKLIMGEYRKYEGLDPRNINSLSSYAFADFRIRLIGIGKEMTTTGTV